MHKGVPDGQQGSMETLQVPCLPAGQGTEIEAKDSSFGHVTSRHDCQIGSCESPPSAEVTQSSKEKRRPGFVLELAANPWPSR